MACRSILDERLIIDPAVGVTAHCDLPGSPKSVPLARRFVRSCLKDVPDSVVEDVLLLTSELTTNVVVHARSDVHLGISHDARNVLVVVQDGSEDPPGECTENAPEFITAIGRGMAIVAATADDFGWKRVRGEPGKIIWFTVGIPVHLQVPRQMRTVEPLVTPPT